MHDVVGATVYCVLKKSTKLKLKKMVKVTFPVSSEFISQILDFSQKCEI